MGVMVIIMIVLYASTPYSQGTSYADGAQTVNYSTGTVASGSTGTSGNNGSAGMAGGTGATGAAGTTGTASGDGCR